MITQNLILDYMTKAKAAPADLKSTQVSFKATGSQFKDVLSSTVSKKNEKPDSDKEINQYSRPQENVDRMTGQGKQVKAFREISKKQPLKDQPSQVSSKEENEKDTEALTSSQNAVKAEVVLSSLAQFLGIKPQELQSLLESAGISTSDLADVTQIAKITDQLSKLLGLNDEQKQILSLAAVETNKQADELLANADSFSGTAAKIQSHLQSGNKKDWVKVEGVNIEVIEQKQLAGDLSKIAGDMKLKLAELANDNSSNPQGFTSQLSEQIRALIVNNLHEKVAANDPALVSGDQASALTDEVGGLKDAADTKEYSSKYDDNKNNDRDTGSEEADQSGGEMNAKTGTVVDHQDILAQDSSFEQAINPAANVVNKSLDGTEAVKMVKEVKAPSQSDIMSQVVDKAKVVVTGEKSEMVMDLKPDSLGKLALKVVTERGIVVAKFIAENQQVKEVLESNMQLLKDSLEKQGLSIQGFSVSVGHESARDFRREQFFERKTGSAGAKGNSREVNTVTSVDMGEEQKKINPYNNMGDSSINFTA